MGDGNSKYGKTIIYTRVPIPNQKDDLQNQVEYLKQYANAKDIVVDEIFEEVGRGLDYNHKKWNKLIKDCMLGLIKTIIVANNEKASPEQEDPILNKFSMGIDLGLKDFAICSNGKTYKNINNSSQIRKLEKRLRREQRSLSRKYESYKRLKKILKGEATRQSIQKQKLKVQKLHQET